MTFTGWAIDRDYLGDDPEYADTRVGYGAASPRRWTHNLSAAEVADPVRFRVLDDDGEVYYGGAISREWIDGDEVYAFDPLAFAQADAGATELQYRDLEEGPWVTL